MVGGSWFFCGSGDIKLIHILIKCGDIFFVYRLPVKTFFIGAVDDFVVDVSEVAHETNFVSEVLKITVKSVEDDGSTSMSDMAVVIDCDSANIHTDLVCLQGYKGFFISGQGIEDK